MQSTPLMHVCGAFAFFSICISLKWCDYYDNAYQNICILVLLSHMTLIFGYWRLTSDPDRIMVLHLHVWPQNEQGVLHILGNTRVGTWSLINSKLCTSFYSNTKLHWMDDLWMGDPDRNRLQPWQIDAEPAATGRGRPHLGDSGRSRDKGYCLGRYWPRLWQFSPSPAGIQIYWSHPTTLMAGRGPRLAAAIGHRCHALIPKQFVLSSWNSVLC